MKKILSLLSLAVLTVGLLGSCSKINERLDNLEKDVNGLKNEKIASIESQIAGITSSIADLGTIRSDISSLKQSAENHGIDIINLEEADRALADRILNLEDYLDDVLPNYAEKEWVEATFSTLEQYDSTCTAIAEINVRIGELDARTARDIQACADSMKIWVNEQLDAYYTAAGMDAKLAKMKSAVDSARAANKITDAKADSIARELAKTKTAVDSAKANIRKEYKAAIKSAIDSSEARLTKKIQNKIDKVNKNVEDLAGRVSVLEAKVDELTGRVDKLEGMIQSVVIVPAYSDGSVQAIDGLLELNLIVSPSSAAKGLTTEKVNILLNSVTTKAASVDTVDTDKIKSFIVDDAKGTVEIKADIKEWLKVLSPTQILTVAVNVKNGDLSDITTEFVTVDNTPGYTVKFNENYVESPATRDTSVIKGGKINKPADPTRDGYFFDKWFTKNQSQDVEWIFDTMTVTQDTTLYAGWIQGMKVTFRKDTLNLTVCKDTIVRPNSTVNKPADPDSTGYVFKGWYTRKSDGSFDTEWNFLSTNVTKDTTLYAKWAKVMTVAQLVATNSEFPTATDNAWVTSEKDSCYFTGGKLIFQNGTKSKSCDYSEDIKLTRQDGGSYQDEEATLTFVMAADRDSVVKITLARMSSPTELNGIYAPKSSIPGFQLWEGGPIFAECNVGAEKPEEAGYYFWWGDTVGYRHDGEKWVSADGTGTSIKFSNESPANTLCVKDAALADYVDANRNLKSDYDAATAHLGAPWRMMTKLEMGELLKCPRTKINTQGEEFKNNGDTFAGWRIQGKEDYSSNSIFLPATGYGDGSDFNSSVSKYLTATPDSEDYWQDVCGFNLNSNMTSPSTWKRYYGCSVRAVRDAE